MQHHVSDVRYFLEGARAIVGAAGRFLPRFAREIDEDYDVRLGCAKFTNVFRDLLENLSSKPFSRTVDLAEDSKKRWPALAQYVEDVDGAKNHLHVFASDVFFNAIAYTVDWIVVDKTPGPKGVSLAEEQKAGAKVYWYHVSQPDMLAVYSAISNGEEIFTHVRFRQNEVVRDGFGERLVERVMIFDRKLISGSSTSNPQYAPATWELQEKIYNTSSVWRRVDGGDVGLGIIPLIPVTTSRREGRSWRFVKTMDDIVHLQKKLYQNETNLEYAKLVTGSPMLSGKDATPPMQQRKVTVNGVDMIIDEPAPLVVGPKTVLYGEWSYVQIDAQALSFLEKEVERIEGQMRELGKQPMSTGSSTSMTVVSSMFAAQKGNSAVQAWALRLKDCLEQAFVYTSMWLGIEDAKPEVAVWTDFSIDLESKSAPEFLLELQKRRLISRTSLLSEGKRRNFLSAEYDSAEDAKLVQDEIDTLEFMALPEPEEIGSGSGPKASGGSSAVDRVRVDVPRSE